MPDYQDFDAYDLLEALELSGRHPDPDLVDAFLQRRDEVASGLLEMLQSEPDESWADDDPRRYREVHAGLLLAEMQHPKALPVFVEMMQDEETDELVSEWFAARLTRYGADILPHLKPILDDPDAGSAALTAISILVRVGQTHPELRPRAIELLRAQLPATRPDGEGGTEVDADDVFEEDVERWSFAVWGLIDLRDAESWPQVEALFEADVLDESILGTAEDVREDIEKDLKDVELPSLQQEYETRQKWESMTDEERDEAMRTDLLASGMTEEEVEAFLAADDEMLDEDFDEDFDENEMMDGLLAQLSEQYGISREQAMPMVEALMVQISESDIDLDDPEAAEELARSMQASGTLPPLPRPETFVKEEQKVGRNDPCICGSGKKYKRCCGR